LIVSLRLIFCQEQKLILYNYLELYDKQPTNRLINYQPRRSLSSEKGRHVGLWHFEFFKLALINFNPKTGCSRQLHAAVLDHERLLQQIIEQHKKKRIFTGIIEAGVLEGGANMRACQGSDAAVGLLAGQIANARLFPQVEDFLGTMEKGKNQKRMAGIGAVFYCILRMRISTSGASFINSTSFKGSVSP
jgi:hypothetical protein